MAVKRRLVFDETLHTGVDEIDDQHRNLVDLTNECADALEDGLSTDQFAHLVRELLSYAIYHFRTEETLMQRYGYADADDAAADAHVRAHREFAARVVSVQEALQNNEEIDSNALFAYLTNWITQHIKGTDKKLAAFILGQRQQPSEAANL